jgi:hypothetical protein
LSIDGREGVQEQSESEDLPCHSVLELSRTEPETNNAPSCFVDFSFLAGYMGILLYK